MSGYGTLFHPCCWISAYSTNIFGFVVFLSSVRFGFDIYWIPMSCNMLCFLTTTWTLHVAKFSPRVSFFLVLQNNSFPFWAYNLLMKSIELLSCPIWSTHNIEKFDTFVPNYADEFTQLLGSLFGTINNKIWSHWIHHE